MFKFTTRRNKLPPLFVKDGMAAINSLRSTLIYSTLQYMKDSLGEFEQIVMLAILRLGEGAYGAAIRTEIEACTGRDPTPGALYTTLDRLETKSMLSSRLAEPTAERGGRAKRFFKLTKAGKEVLTEAQRSYQRLLKGLNLLGGSHA
jgi:PadR family transcriptional regulator, regulatory protein PadR